MTCLRCLSVLALVALGAGCGDDGADPDAGGGMRCGAVTCDDGLICCNASCGACVAPGESCSSAPCGDGGGLDAGPTEGGDGGGEDAGRDAGRERRDAGGVACGEGTCGASERCCPGCGGVLACVAGGGPCPDAACAACDAETPCPEGSYCDHPGDACGGDGECLPTPMGCPEDCPGVCGCDGEEYCNRCLAAAEGVDTANDGPCAEPPDCAPMDAHGIGPCAAFFGYAWSGTSCVGVSGCDCAGRDCERTFETPEACAAAYAHCPGTSRTCGGFLGLVCSRSEYCDFPEGERCGFADGGGVCRPRPEVCTDEFDPVCGCDGEAYGNECEAHAAGTDVATRGPCRRP